MEKGPGALHANLDVLLDFLAPQPVLEPGTYGLTEAPTRAYAFRKPKIGNEFSGAGHSGFSKPNRKLNLCLSMARFMVKKLNTINGLQKTSVEQPKTAETD